MLIFFCPNLLNETEGKNHNLLPEVSAPVLHDYMVQYQWKNISLLIVLSGLINAPPPKKKEAKVVLKK